MVQDCKVILNNDLVTVARFNNIDIQFPSIHKAADSVRVLYKDGKYTIVDPDYQEVIKKNKKSKKTTNLEIIEQNETQDEQLEDYQ